MKNLSSYCGLVDVEIRASDKDLPVQRSNFWNLLLGILNLGDFWLPSMKFVQKCMLSNDDSDGELSYLNSPLRGIFPSASYSRKTTQLSKSFSVNDTQISSFPTNYLDISKHFGMT